MKGNTFGWVLDVLSIVTHRQFDDHLPWTTILQVLNAKRPQFSYNGKRVSNSYIQTKSADTHLIACLILSVTEKQLRDAAAAEVAVHGLYGNEDVGDKSSRKRKHMNADEKAKQKSVQLSYVMSHELSTFCRALYIYDLSCENQFFAVAIEIENMRRIQGCVKRRMLWNWRNWWTRWMGRRTWKRRREER